MCNSTIMYIVYFSFRLAYQVRSSFFTVNAPHLLTYTQPSNDNNYDKYNKYHYNNYTTTAIHALTPRYLDKAAFFNTSTTTTTTTSTTTTLLILHDLDQLSCLETTVPCLYGDRRVLLLTHQAHATLCSVLTILALDSHRRYLQTKIHTVGATFM